MARFSTTRRTPQPAFTALARSGEILITEETVNLLDTDHLTSTRLFDTTTVRGKSRPVGIYRAIVEEATQATLSPPPRGLEPAHARHHVLLLSCATGREIRVDQEGQAVIMGRDERCDLVVDGPYASRRHAVVEAKRDRFVLIDESINGTFVVNQNNEVAFLRRDALTLQGQSLILFGGEPGTIGTAHVAYRCLRGVTVLQPADSSLPLKFLCTAYLAVGTNVGSGRTVDGTEGRRAVC